MTPEVWITVDGGETFEGNYEHWNNTFFSLTEGGMEISDDHKIFLIVGFCISQKCNVEISVKFPKCQHSCEVHEKV